MKLAEEAMPPSPLGRGDLATTIRLVAVDVIVHPGSSVHPASHRGLRPLRPGPPAASPLA